MIVNFLTFISLIVVFIFKAKHYAHMLQQNSYRNERFLKWYKDYLNKKRGVYIEVLFLIGLFILLFFQQNISAFLLSILYLSAILVRYKYRSVKKALVITNRVKRIFICFTIVTVLILLLNYIILGEWSTYIYPILFVLLIFPIYTIAINYFLKPIELNISNRYLKDAKNILSQKKNLTVIGITGSYGKTSTKHFLHTILSEKFTTLMTPGSFNTTMGVVRTIREYLKPIHEVFIVEMGAKHIGDIKEISEIVNQEISILTSIGPQHLDTFLNIENVQKAKTEIIKFASEKSFAVLNYDYELIRESSTVIEKNHKSFFSIKEPLNSWHTKNIKYSESGMEFDIIDNKGDFFLSAKTKLLGEFNISNILSAVIVANALGIEIQKIKRGILRIEPVKHRLQIINRKETGVTIIDDSFNSNPLGAKMALDVLSKIGTGKKVIITPGMIELGNEHYNLNKNFGEQISEVCDSVVLVGEMQTKPIFDGLMSKGYDVKNIYIAKNLKDASNYVNSNIKEGDVALYENDLPDTYNE